MLASLFRVAYAPFALGLEVGGEVLGDVVEEDDCGEEDEADEGYLVEALLDLGVEVAAEEAFDGEQDDGAAVEDGEGEEVDDAEVEGDLGHEDDDGGPAGGLEGFVDLDADADGAGEGLDGVLAGEESGEDLVDEA